MPAGKAGVFPSHDPGLATVLPRKGGMPEEPSPRQRPCGKVWERLCSCRRFPCPLPSGTEGWAGRGLRESGVCGIKVIFARVAELVDALDLESSGLSIRVQVPSLAPSQLYQHLIQDQGPLEHGCYTSQVKQPSATNGPLVIQGVNTTSYHRLRLTVFSNSILPLSAT